MSLFQYMIYICFTSLAISNWKWYSQREPGIFIYVFWALVKCKNVLKQADYSRNMNKRYDLFKFAEQNAK